MYEIPIRPGIRFQPHPAFARNPDGSYVYFPLQPGELDDKSAIPDFPQTGTRKLTADDYVYAFRRCPASLRLASPIYSLMADYVVGMKEYGERLRALDQPPARSRPRRARSVLAGSAPVRLRRR